MMGKDFHRFMQRRIIHLTGTQKDSPEVEARFGPRPSSPDKLYRKIIAVRPMPSTDPDSRDCSCNSGRRGKGRQSRNVDHWLDAPTPILESYGYLQRKNCRIREYAVAYSTFGLYS